MKHLTTMMVCLAVVGALPAQDSTDESKWVEVTYYYVYASNAPADGYVAGPYKTSVEAERVREHYERYWGRRADYPEGWCNLQVREEKEKHYVGKAPEESPPPADAPPPPIELPGGRVVGQTASSATQPSRLPLPRQSAQPPPPSQPAQSALPSVIYYVAEFEHSFFGLGDDRATGGYYWSTDPSVAKQWYQLYENKNGCAPKLILIRDPNRIASLVRQYEAAKQAQTAAANVYNPPPTTPVGPNLGQMMMMSQMMNAQSQQLIQQQMMQSAMLRNQMNAATQQVFQQSIQNMGNIPSFGNPGYLPHLINNPNATLQPQR